MQNITKNNKKFNIKLFAVVALSLALFGAIFGFGYAWLSDYFTTNTNSQIGSVNVQILNNNVVVNGAYVNNGIYSSGDAIVLDQTNDQYTNNITIKNTGTIPAIVMLDVFITTKTLPAGSDLSITEGGLVISTSNLSATYNNSQVLYKTGLDASNNVVELNYLHAYQVFINTTIDAGQSVNVFSEIAALNGFSDDINIYISANAVAHSGNAYQIDSAENPVDDSLKPFGNLHQDFLARWTAWK